MVLHYICVLVAFMNLTTYASERVLLDTPVALVVFPFARTLCTAWGVEGLALPCRLWLIIYWWESRKYALVQTTPTCLTEVLPTSEQLWELWFSSAVWMVIPLTLKQISILWPFRCETLYQNWRLVIISKTPEVLVFGKRTCVEQKIA